MKGSVMEKEKYYFIKSYKDEALYANITGSKTVTINVDYKSGLTPWEYKADLLESKSEDTTSFFDDMTKDDILKSLSIYHKHEIMTFKTIREKFNSMTGNILPQEWIDEVPDAYYLDLLTRKEVTYNPATSTTLIGCSSVDYCRDCKLLKECGNDFGISDNDKALLSDMLVSLRVKG